MVSDGVPQRPDGHGCLLQEPGTDGPLTITVAAVDEAQATELVRKWRADRDAQGQTSPLSEEDEVRQLRQKVLVGVTDRFEYRVDDPDAAVLLTLEPPPAPPAVPGPADSVPPPAEPAGA